MAHGPVCAILGGENTQHPVHRVGGEPGEDVIGKF